MRLFLIISCLLTSCMLAISDDNRFVKDLESIMEGIKYGDVDSLGRLSDLSLRQFVRKYGNWGSLIELNDQIDYKPRVNLPAGGTIVVLVWVDMEAYIPYMKYDLSGCNVPCEWTYDRGRFHEASGVIFHAHSFPVHSSLSTGLPGHKLKGQTWTMVDLEPELWGTPQANHYFKNLMDYKMSFHYATDEVPINYISDFGDLDVVFRQRKGNFVSDGNLKEKTPLTSAPRDEGFGAKKNDYAHIAAYISGCPPHNVWRNEGMAKLKELIPVDNWGKCWTNQHGSQTKDWVLAHYPFFLAWENNDMSDYVSEKLWAAFVTGTLPIYFGSDLAKMVAPGNHSFIHFRDFGTYEALVDHLNTLLNDQAAYDAYFEWKKHPLNPAFVEYCTSGAYTPNAPCRLCRRIAKDVL